MEGMKTLDSQLGIDSMGKNGAKQKKKQATTIIRAVKGNYPNE
jgi:hypothetical protein